MDILPLLCIVSVTFTGLAKGAGVLPDVQNAAEGETVMFKTTLTPPETPFSLVNWRFGDRTIINFDNGGNTTGSEYDGRITLSLSTGSLQLRNVSLNESGEYKVTVYPVGGTVRDGAVRLDVYEPVSNVEANASSTEFVEFNSSVRLSCSSSGSSLSFLWMNGSSEVTASDRVQLTEGGASLTIVNVTRYDEGPFVCNVSNPVSHNDSDPINLSISYGPENVRISPSQEYHEEGSNISLSCSADSRPAAQFKWFLNGDLLPDTGPELILTNIQMSQSGNYSCQAFNNKTSTYQTSQSAAVTVLKRISDASVRASTIVMIEGISANLTCEAAGSVFSRKWMKDGSDLILADNMTLYDENRLLSFNSLNRKHNGAYSCKISNPINNEEPKYIMVVNYGPESVKVFGRNKIQEKETLNLTCSADSTPSASFTWKLNGTEMHNSSEFIKDSTEFSDSGSYTCTAMNDITGRTSSMVHELTIIAQQHQPSCSAGCIAGIVIACIVFCGAAAGGGYYIYKQKPHLNTSFNGTTATRTGGEGKGEDNTGFLGSQELNYADIRFVRNKDGGTVQLGSQNNSEYSEVHVNSSRTAASSPPTYDTHIQRAKRPAPQPGAYGT